MKQHAQSAMRAAIGELELDQILHARAQLNSMIRLSVQEAAEAWGLEIKALDDSHTSAPNTVLFILTKYLSFYQPSY